MITAWGSEFRAAARVLGRSPGFTLAAVLTLALGLAAVASVGTWIYALLVRPLPGVGNQRLLVLAATERGELGDEPELSVLELEALRASGIFAGVGGAIARNFTLTGDFEPERVAGVSITTDFLALAGVPMFAGRDFRPDEGRAFGFEESAILAHGLWLRRFGGDPRAVGSAIEINQRRLTVVGVLPPGFGLPDNEALYLPWSATAVGPVATDPRHRMLWTIAAPFAGAADPAGVEMQSRLDALLGVLAAQAPAAERNRGVRALALRQALVDWDDRRTIALLAGLVGGVLLVACANVALLQLARGTARSGEMSVRRALGASRWRRMRPLLVQSLLLALAGTALGVILGRALLSVAAAAMEEELPPWLSFQLDPGQLALAALLALSVALVSGLLPALAVSEAGLGSALRSSRDPSGGRRERRWQSLLVGAQFAVSLLLLACAGWMGGSLRALAQADVGFAPQQLLSLRFNLPGDRYDQVAARVDLHRRLGESLAAEPGVAAVATTSALPADDGGVVEHLFLEGETDDAAGVAAGVMTAAPGFFGALGAGLIAGRPLSDLEAADPQSGAAVINRALALRLWPQLAGAPGEAVGRRFRIVGQHPEPGPLEVVGIAPDLVYEEIHEQTAASRHQVWLSYARRPGRSSALVVRAREGIAPADLAPAVRRALAQLEPHAPIYDARPYSARLRQTYEDRTLLARLISLFAALTLALAAVGTAGLVGFVAARRTREIGLRMALGATRRDVVRTLAAAGLRPLAAGSIAGVALTLACGRFLSALTYGIDTGNPAWTVGAALLLSAAGALACLLPARRASGIEPTAALRSD